MNELLRVALDASLEAGKAILEIYGSEDVGVEYKEDQSPLTRADRAAHEVLMKHLEPTGIPVLSEEGKHMPFEDRRSWDALWIVDPVDGTKEFIKRNGEFTVNVALVKAGRVVCGVVLAPVLGHAYVGEVGSGAWRCEVDMAGDTSVDEAGKPVRRFRWPNPRTVRSPWWRAGPTCLQKPRPTSRRRVRSMAK